MWITHKGKPAGIAVILGGVNYAQLLFPDFFLIVCGYLVCRYTALNRTVWEQVESLIYYFLFPVLLFHSIVRSPLDLGAASSLIGAGLLMGVTGIAMAYQPALPALAALPASTRANTRPARRWPFASTPSSPWPWPTAWPAPRACS